jgi:hypothetical protein
MSIRFTIPSEISSTPSPSLASTSRTTRQVRLSADTKRSSKHFLELRALHDRDSQVMHPLRNAVRNPYPSRLPKCARFNAPTRTSSKAFLEKRSLHDRDSVVMHPLRTKAVKKTSPPVFNVQHPSRSPSSQCRVLSRSRKLGFSATPELRFLFPGLQLSTTDILRIEDGIPILKPSTWSMIKTDLAARARAILREKPSRPALDLINEQLSCALTSHYAKNLFSKPLTPFHLSNEMKKTVPSTPSKAAKSAPPPTQASPSSVSTSVQTPKKFYRTVSASTADQQARPPTLDDIKKYILSLPPSEINELWNPRSEVHDLNTAIKDLNDLSLLFHSQPVDHSSGLENTLVYTPTLECIQRVHDGVQNANALLPVDLKIDYVLQPQRDIWSPDFRHISFPTCSEIYPAHPLVLAQIRRYRDTLLFSN